MGLLGNGFDDPQTAANLALAGNMVRGGLNGGFGGGLLAAGQAYQDAQSAALRRQLGGVQIQDMQQQIRLRDLQAQQAQRQMEWTNNLLGDMGSAPAPQGGMSGPATAPTAGGPMGSGTFGMPVGGQSSFSPTNAPASTGGGSLIQQARALGIPDMAIKADIALNGGKGIAEMIYKRGTPNMQFVGNVAVDQNKVQPGFSVPTVSQNGQASQTIMDPTAPGGFRVIAPPGALDTYTGYRNADAGIAAKNDVQKVWNPQAQRYDYVTKAQILDAAQPPQSGPRPLLGSPQPSQPGPRMFPTEASMSGQANVDMGANPAVLASEITKTQASIPLVKDPASKAMLTAYLTDLQRQQAALQRGPMAAEPSQTEANTSAANKTFLEGRAKGANEYESSLNGRVQQGADMNLRLQEQLAALGKFRAGGGAETRAQLAQYAQSIPGMPDWVVKGVAGGDLSAMQEFNKLAAQTAMEQLKQSMGGAGRISQYEFKVFQNNNPNLSTDPNAIRKIFDFNTKIYGRDLQEQQAFNSFIKQGNDPAEFQNYWQQRQVQDGHTNPSMRAQTAEAPKSNLLNDLPKIAAKGARVRDTQTGDILTFNGLSWVKGK